MADPQQWTAAPSLTLLHDFFSMSNTTNAPGQVVTILLVNGAALKFASPDGDDLRHLIEFMMDGLKQRSVYGIASETVYGKKFTSLIQDNH